MLPVYKPSWSKSYNFIFYLYHLITPEVKDVAKKAVLAFDTAHAKANFGVSY